MQKIKLAIAGVLVAVASYLIGGSNIPAKLSGFSNLQSYPCTSYTVGSATVGHQLSTQVLSANSRRAYAKIQAPSANNAIYVSFATGTAAVVGKGLAINGASTTPDIVFGLNTDDPYTGAVTVITDTASTSVLITECKY